MGSFLSILHKTMRCPYLHWDPALMGAPLSVCTSVRPSISPSHFVVVFLSLQLLLQNLMKGFETCNTVQICIERVHKRNRVLIQVIIAELCPLE